MSTRRGVSSPPPLYRALIRLLSPLLVLHCVWIASRGGGWRYLVERLGFGTTTPPCDYWLHAASVGEVMTVLPLVQAILKRHPQRTVLLTTITHTGAAIVAERHISGVTHAYLPIDWPGAVKRFLRRHEPRSAWIVETEIWPWLYTQCKRAGIPLGIVNGRLSTRTWRMRDGPLSTTYTRALAGVRVLARSEQDAERFRDLGAADVVTAGNLKLADNRTAGSPRRLLDRPYTLLASTHHDEEERFAQRWLRDDGADLLVIVPRHPARSARIVAALERCLAAASTAGGRCRRRSAGEQPAADDRLFLADTLGELQDWYAHAGAVAVGGSWVATGGHNLLEPARHGKAAVTGPFLDNFTDVAEWLEAHEALLQVSTVDEAVTLLRRLAHERAFAARLGERAARAAAHTGDTLARYLAATDEARR